jgi:aspartate-semialdehyde dehydrogenase
MKINLDLAHIARKDLRIAIIGATGMVGTKMLEVLEETNLEMANLILVASQRSIGQQLNYKGQPQAVVSIDTALELRPHIALFAAEAATAAEYAPRFAAVGTKVIDNSSYFRLADDVPLVVPEVNLDAISPKHGIIANPNCSTIQLVAALAPLHRIYGLRRLVISTYQAVSGTGIKAMEQYKEEREGEKAANPAYWHQIFENCLPQCDDFAADGSGYTKEELKMVNETRKILAMPTLPITATAVRVPVLVGHSESVNAAFAEAFDMATIRRILAAAPSIILQDSPQNNSYPMPILAAGQHEVFVGRLRRDESQPNGLNMWIVADNLLKGAATNAVQIAKYLIEKNMISAQ